MRTVSEKLGFIGSKRVRSVQERLWDQWHGLKQRVSVQITNKAVSQQQILDCSRGFQQNYRCRAEKSMPFKRLSGKCQLKAIKIYETKEDSQQSAL